MTVDTGTAPAPVLTVLCPGAADAAGDQIPDDVETKYSGTDPAVWNGGCTVWTRAEINPVTNFGGVSNQPTGTLAQPVVIDALLNNPRTVVTADLDGDGAPDVVADTYEGVMWWRNPLRDYPDGDGVSDDLEVCVLGTDPLLADTDGGGRTDGEEVCDLADPRDPAGG